MPHIDFSHGGKRKYTPLPAGTYRCEVTKIDDAKRTKNGDEMWNVELTISAGSHAKRRVFDRLVFSDNDAAKKRLAIFCKAIGIDPTGTVDLTVFDALGKHVDVKLEIEEYNGEKRNRVAFDGYIGTVMVVEEIEPAVDTEANSEAGEREAPEDGISDTPAGEIAAKDVPF